MLKCFVFISLFLFSFFSRIATAKDCAKDDAKSAVEHICSVIENQGAEKAKAEVAKYRFCDTNYVWLQKSGEVTMVTHPIKNRLDGKSLKEHKDEKGKFLFVEFDKAANADPMGGWVDYLWAKPGAEKATRKESFVKKCKGDLNWIAGAGVWTE